MADATDMTLGVERDAETNALCLRVLFRQDAPNISLSKALISWYPTAEEISLLNEAFALIPNKAPVMESPQPSTPPDPPLQRTPETTGREQDEFPVEEAKKLKEGEERVLVQVDDKLIEEALQRRKQADHQRTNADAVVDRLTKKRKLL